MPRCPLLSESLTDPPRAHERPHTEDLWTKMRRERRPFLYNDEDWGFGAHELPEVVLRDGSPEFIERSPSAATGGRAADTLA